MVILKEKIYYFIKNHSFKEIFTNLFLKEMLSAFIGFILASLLTNLMSFFIALFLFTIVVTVVSIFVSSKNHQFDILNIIKKEMQKGNWIEVIRLGYPLSRTLWLSGRYSLRVEIGEMLKNAATRVQENIKIGDSSLSRNFILASLLIDDLGWTRYVLGQKEKAKSNILEGIKIAKENKLWELAIKGNRHLIGINSNKNKKETSKKYLTEIEELLKNIQDEKKKQSIYAGVLFAKAEILLKYGDLSEAEILAKKTQEMYLKIEDYERYVKSFCLIGEILIQGGTDKYNEAELVINQGAEVAKKWQRKERYVKIAVLFINLKVLKICNDDNYTLQEYFSDKEEVDMFYNEAKSLAKDIQNEVFRLELSKSYRCFIKNAKKYIKRGF